MTRRKHRSSTPEQKFEIVMEALEGKRNVTDVCRDHRIGTTLFYTWRDQLLSGGVVAAVGRGTSRTLRRCLCARRSPHSSGSWDRIRSSSRWQKPAILAIWVQKRGSQGLGPLQ
jgi:transposase-like protein